MIGDKIRDLRESRRWTMKDLAAEAKITAPMVSRYENGQASPSKRILKRLSTAFEVPLSELTLDNPSPEDSNKIKLERLISRMGALSAEEQRTIEMVIESFVYRAEIKKLK